LEEQAVSCEGNNARERNTHTQGKTNLDFTEARDSEWQWHQMGHMQICTSRWTNSHASTPPLSFLQAGCPYCRPTSSFKALLEREKQNITTSCKIQHACGHLKLLYDQL